MELKGRKDIGLDSIKMLDYIIANDKLKDVKEGKLQELINTIYKELARIERIKELIDEQGVYVKGEFKWWKAIDTAKLVEILCDVEEIKNES